MSLMSDEPFVEAAELLWWRLRAIFEEPGLGDRDVGIGMLRDALERHYRAGQAAEHHGLPHE